MQEGLVHWLHESHDINICFSTSSLPSQMDSSIGLRNRNVSPVPSEKVSANLQTVSDNAGPVEGIDSNIKPVEKPKRKKHRPKVIKEGQSAKTRKSTISKPPKDKGNESTGKRKYVRRKGLHTPTKQSSSQDCNTHKKAEPSPARRSLNFSGNDQQDNADLVLQAQLTGEPTGPVDPRSSFSAVERTPAQMACHLGGPSISISSSVHPMASMQHPQADSMSNEVVFDLNNSINQMPHKCANLMSSSDQFIQSVPRETAQIDKILDFHAGSSGNSIFHLNSSVNEMHNSSADFSQYLGPSQSSEVHRPDLMFCGRMMLENPVAHLQHTETVSTRGNSNPETCNRKAMIINQMMQGYQVRESPIAPSTHIERVVTNRNLNQFALKNDYLQFATNQNNNIGAQSYSDLLHLPAMGKKREHNAISGPQSCLDMIFEHSNNARQFYHNTHSTSPQKYHFPETCKKMRSENHKNCLNGSVDKFASFSAYLPNNQSTIGVSAINSGICSISDLQRLLEREKSQSSQRAIGLMMSETNMIERPNMVQLHKYSSLHDSSNEDFMASRNKQFRYCTSQHIQLPGSTMNSLEENNIPGIESYQLQPLEISPTLHYSTGKDCVTLSDKQSKYITPEHTKLASGTLNQSIENYIIGNGIHHHEYLENHMVKGADLAPVTHNASTYDDTVKNCCCAIRDEQNRNTSAEAVGSPSRPINQSTQTEHYHLAASRETKSAKPTKKPRGRPRKEAGVDGKPKGRSRRKENVGLASCILSKGRQTDLLNSEAEGICRGSEPSTGITSNMEMLESERNEKRTSIMLEMESFDHDKYSSLGCSQTYARSISEVIAVSVDPLDAIIEKLLFLYLNNSNGIVAAVPNNTLVPYKGESGALVPFEGNVKKRHPRAKVNLDPITNLVWNLLMEPDFHGSEGMDKDKEKWLEEERRVFRGRIDSFIARMHLVQGDRRFSPWKGSVVDSVVGVFLTQNVSDHLSSSAFMAVAAKFPVKSENTGKPVAEMSHAPPEQKDSCSGLFGDSIRLQGKLSVEEMSDIRSLTSTDDNEGSNSNELIGSSSGYGVSNVAGEISVSNRKSLPGLHEKSTPGSVAPAIGIASVVEAEDGSPEDVISSQNSAVSSQNSPDYLFQRFDPVGSSSLPCFTEEDFIIRNLSNGMASSTAHTVIPQIQDLGSMHNTKFGSSEYRGSNLHPVPGVNKGVMLDLNRTYEPVHTSVSYAQNDQFDFTGTPYTSHFEKSFCTDLEKAHNSIATQSEASFYQLPSAITANKYRTQMTDCASNLLYSIDGSLVEQRVRFPYDPSPEGVFSQMIEQNHQPSINSKEALFSREHSCCENSSLRNETEAPFVEQDGRSNLEEVHTTTKHVENKSWSGFCQQESDLRVQARTCEELCSSDLCKNQLAHSEVSGGVPSDLIGKSKDAQKDFVEVPTDESKAKKARGRPKKKAYDWDNLRKEVFCNDGNNQRSHNAKDTVDWEAVRQADVKEISETIRERGMNNMLAERIKEFLNRLVRDHGSIDLEWLRVVQPDKAKDYLLSIRGLGLKSVECVRLLTLHHMAFPVDTNVGRICVRLGWVPLQPLPESLQLHLLELYPMLEHIQKYLWPRLCKLDQRTLYELHYQMITFGKVFCTKSKPNCNACPMRAECKHFASAFASARLALPGPEEKSLVASEASNAATSCHQTYIDPKPVGQLDWSASDHGYAFGNHQPIIEEPSTPEPEPQSPGTKEGAIEDLFSEDSDEIPIINLNIEEFTQNLKSYMQANNIEVEDAGMSKALVAITPEAASIPTPKLKNVSRLRTEHQVYELPDTHPLLEGLDRRQPDDPCPYLLSIWTPGETAQSTDAPKTFCNSQETGNLCQSSTCFSCNSVREMQAQKVRGTILIPCRTAMRGSFPLNGTYFQVNEVFADHFSSQNPIDVPRSWIWNLPRRTVYFGTSVPTIFRGLTTEEIQQCFWRGFVCVRGFDRTSRAPRPLYARLHFPASKVTRGKRPAAARVEE